MKKYLFCILVFILQWNTISAQNTNVSGGFIFEGEPFLVINPNNSQHMVVAWMGFEPSFTLAIKTKVSIDAGDTWSAAQNTPHVIEGYTSADPSMEFDLDNNLYLSYIDSNSGIDSGSVYVRKSIDGGYSWGEAVQVIDYYSDPDKKPIDRPWIAVDKSEGTNDGNIYITTMSPRSAGYVPPPYHPYLTKSIDNGESFGDWRYIDTTSWLAGSLILQPMATPTTGPDGKFHCVYTSYVLGQNILPQFIHASSDDGGESFDYHSVFASVTYPTDTLSKKGYLLRANPANENHLALFYIFSPYGDADIMMRESLDGGSNWSEEVRINDDPVSNGSMQDLVWADFDLDGDLVVAWRDRRSVQDTGYAIASEIYGTVRMNGDSDFSQNFEVSDELVPHEDILNGSGNDFLCVKFRDDTINVVWGDVRTGVLNIWFQRLTSEGVFVSKNELNNEDQIGLSIYPNPASKIVHVKCQDILSISVFNPIGTIVLEKFYMDLPDQVDIDVSAFAQGNYKVAVNTGKGTYVGQIECLH